MFANDSLWFHEPDVLSEICRLLRATVEDENMQRAECAVLLVLQTKHISQIPYTDSLTHELLMRIGLQRETPNHLQKFGFVIAMSTSFTI